MASRRLVVCAVGAASALTLSIAAVPLLPHRRVYAPAEWGPKRGCVHFLFPEECRRIVRQGEWETRYPWNEWWQWRKPPPKAGKARS